MEFWSWLKNLGLFVRESWVSVKPGPLEWRGAALGMLAVVLMILLSWSVTAYSGIGFSRFLIGTGVQVLGVLLPGLILILLGRLLSKLPFFFAWMTAAALGTQAVIALTVAPAALGAAAVIVWLSISACALGVGLSMLWRDRWRWEPRIRQALGGGSLFVGAAGILVGLGFLFWPGNSLEMPPNAAALNQESIPALSMPDPTQRGQHPVLRLCYGNEASRWRERCKEELYITTSPVDGSALLEGWNSLRAAYWNFGPEALPLNGRVWYPQGRGPFPLVLIAHGNSPMQRPSDEGYAYLGELLASRGFIIVSLDHNFLNLSWYTDFLGLAGIQGDNDARALLMLEHARLWLDWNRDANSPIAGIVDEENLALIGHSRGGEAAAIAAVFNHLSYHPDDASIGFDYHFNIRGVAAISPSDGQFQPTGVKLPLIDTSYLVMHGSHDMDVVTFMGARQYNRTSFRGEDFHMKSSVYIFGANHGQFNTVWGRRDLMGPGFNVFNVRQLIPPEDQRQIAAVYLSAFLESTLKGEEGYLPLFQDHRTAREWLPETVLLTQYADSHTLIISGYDEDIDLTTTSLKGGVQHGEGLVTWREQVIPARWGSTENRAVYLGWDASEGNSSTASYRFLLPEEGIESGRESVLVFSLGDAGEYPHGSPSSEPAGVGELAGIDLTIELVDGNGVRSRLPLSRFRLLQPVLKPQLTKAAFMLNLPKTEIILQSFELPLGTFVEANRSFDPDSLVEVGLIFDRTEAGLVVLDNVGLR